MGASGLRSDVESVIKEVVEIRGSPHAEDYARASEAGNVCAYMMNSVCFRNSNG